MKFNYQARTKEGQVQKGVVEASSSDTALIILQKYGLYVTSLEEVAKGPIYNRQIKLFQGISKKDVAVFTRQLAIMFKSQVPIVESLTAIARQASKADFKEKIMKLSEEIEGGSPLSSAFSIYPKLFSPFYINMIKSGEASGKLTESLDYLADHLEKEYNFQNKIKGAMLYPVFVFIVFAAVFSAMIFFILPPLTQVLKETGQELPLITKAIIAFSEFLKKWFWLAVIILAGGIFFGLKYIKTEEGKKDFDRFSLKIPIISSLLKKIYLTRFAENLSTLISGGIPIARALEISGEVVGNYVYKSIIFTAMDEVRKGEQISATLENYPNEISPLFIQMAMVGEKTGRLGSSLLNIVTFYQDEVDRTIDSLIRLLEPLMLIVLGLAVAGLLAGVLLPLYSVGLG
ncbi:MAG: type II secretion system F family protein [Candidatus Pacebacteria bacterium]|nr:type II secretion system F family protein [Candidatus Paceibacterota bacterium]